MLAGLQLLHKRHPEAGDLDKIAEHGAVFQTCLRLIQLRWGDENVQVPSGFDFLTGEKAYQFLLETICGLHSPVVGETEVFGQFKAFKAKTSWSYPLQVVMDNLIIDTKKTRDKFLKDLGGQSYGSVVRKYSKEFHSVAFIGAGQFTEELLPWVYKEGKSVTVHARDLQKAEALRERYPRISVVQIGAEQITADMVIVAAPLNSQRIQELVPAAVKMVLDLRGECRLDACSQFSRYVTLDQVFRIIESNQKQIHISKAQALAEISDLTLKRSLFEVLRPFGWDDICVW